MTDWSDKSLTWPDVRRIMDADPRAALMELDSAIADFSGSSLAHAAFLYSCRAHCLAKLTRFSEAIEDSRRSISFYSDTTGNGNHYDVGHLHMRIGMYILRAEPSDMVPARDEYEKALERWNLSGGQSTSRHYVLSARISLLRLAQLTSDAQLADQQLDEIFLLAKKGHGWHHEPQTVEPEIQAFNMTLSLEDRWANHQLTRHERLSEGSDVIGLDYVALRYLKAEDSGGQLREQANEQLSDDLASIESPECFLRAAQIAYTFSDDASALNLLEKYIKTELDLLPVVVQEFDFNSSPQRVFSKALLLNIKRPQIEDAPKRLAALGKIIDLASQSKRTNLVRRYCLLDLFLRVSLYGHHQLQPRLLTFIAYAESWRFYSDVVGFAELALEIFPEMNSQRRCSTLFSQGIAKFYLHKYAGGKAACIRAMQEIGELSGKAQLNLLQKLTRLAYRVASGQNAIPLLDVIVELALSMGRKREELYGRLGRVRAHRRGHNTMACGPDLYALLELLDPTTDLFHLATVHRLLAGLCRRTDPQDSARHISLALKNAESNRSIVHEAIRGEGSDPYESQQRQLEAADICVALAKLERGKLFRGVPQPERELIGALFDKTPTPLQDFDEALKIFEVTGQVSWQAHVELQLALLCLSQKLPEAETHFYRAWKLYKDSPDRVVDPEQLARDYFWYLKRLNLRVTNQRSFSPETLDRAIDLVLTGLLAHMGFIRRNEKWMQGEDRARSRKIQIFLATTVLQTLTLKGKATGYEHAEVLELLSPLFLQSLMSPKSRDEHPTLAAELAKLSYRPSPGPLLDEAQSFDNLDAAPPAAPPEFGDGSQNATSMEQRKEALDRIQLIVRGELRELLETPEIDSERTFQELKTSDCTTLQVVFPDGVKDGARVWRVWTPPDDHGSFLTEEILASSAVRTLKVLTSDDQTKDAPWPGWTILDDGTLDQGFSELSHSLLPMELVAYLAERTETIGGPPARLLIVPDAHVWNVPWAALVARPMSQADERLADIAVLSQIPALIMANSGSSKVRARREALHPGKDDVIAYFNGVEGTEHESEVLNGFFGNRYTKFTDAHTFISALTHPADDQARLCTISVHGDQTGGLNHSLRLNAKTDLTAAQFIGARLPEILVIGACWSSRVNSNPDHHALGLTTLALTQGSNHIISGSYPLPDTSPTGMMSPTAEFLGDLYELLAVHDPALALHHARQLRRNGPVHMWAGLAHTTSRP